jgi:flagellar protein FliT
MAVDTLFSCYEALALIMGRMRDAARASDWDGLSDMQSEYGAIVDRLSPLDRIELDDAQRRRKHDLVRRILTDDAEIRELINPRMARLSALLASSRQSRALQNSYGSGQFGQFRS